MRVPAFVSEQAVMLDWLAAAHAASAVAMGTVAVAERESYRERMRKVIARCACGPERIARRGHVLNMAWGESTLYDLERYPRGAGTAARTLAFAEIAGAELEALYAAELEPPAELVHVTCTGYVAPSPAQLLVERRGWGKATRVTHAYHMGCYAALAAVRLAAGALALHGGGPRVEIAHTELCSLHFDPGAHSIEQLVVQSLFADGIIRYAAVAEAPSRGLRVLALSERLVPGTAAEMRWFAGDHGMTMTLGRDVPARIGAVVGEVVDELYARAGLDARSEVARSRFAVHPGGPRIVDGVRDALALDEAQVAVSRAVLFERGNMSWATLPHVWQRLLAAPDVEPGTLIASLAFGPGLTVCAALFRKE